jgi:hypothetical protein
MPKIYGPYKGSKQNKGRPIYVVKTKKKTTSVNKARKDYEDKNGKLPRALMLTIRTTIIRMILGEILERYLMGRILLRRTNAGLGKKSNACFVP